MPAKGAQSVAQIDLDITQQRHYSERKKLRMATSLHDRYTIGEVVGEGGFGKVHKGWDRRLRRDVAIKINKNVQQAAVLAQKEAKLLLKLRELDKERFIVRMYAEFTSESNHQMVLEYLPGGNLKKWTQQNYPGGLPLGKAKMIGLQMCKALAFLKECGIVHGDIKADNFVLACPENPSSLKLIDFGLAMELTSPGLRMLGGIYFCLPYRAPEMVLGYPSDWAVDMWSLGCTLMGLALGIMQLFPVRDQVHLMSKMMSLIGMPPDHLLDQATYTGVYFTKQDGHYRPRKELAGQLPKNGEPRFLLHHLAAKHRKMSKCLHTPYVAAKFYDFIRRMLVYDPALRLKPEHALNHVFLK